MFYLLGEAPRRIFSGTIDKEGYKNRPPLLDGSNYDWCKVRMVAFLKSMDNKAWMAILKEWEHPDEKDKDGNVSLKAE